MNDYIICLSTNPIGIVLSIVLLYATIATLERSPGVKQYLHGKPHLKRIAAALVASGAALIAHLVAKVPAEWASSVGLMAFLAASGLNAQTKVPLWRTEVDYGKIIDDVMKEKKDKNP